MWITKHHLLSVISVLGKILTAVSICLFLVVMFFGARSYYVDDAWDHCPDSGTCFQVVSAGGVLSLEQVMPFGPTTLFYHHESPHVSDRIYSNGWRPQAVPMYRRFMLDASSGPFFLALPDWFLGLLAVISPTYWAVIAFSRWRFNRSPHLCPHCRYDLRATPVRCPECGATCKAASLPDESRASGS